MQGRRWRILFFRGRGEREVLSPAKDDTGISQASGHGGVGWGWHLLAGSEQGEKTVPGHRRKGKRCNQVAHVPVEKPGHSGNIKVARGTEQITQY